MATFLLEQYELHTMTYRIEANSEAEAIKTLLDGSPSDFPISCGLKYIEIAKDFGMSLEEDSELAEELWEIHFLKDGQKIVHSIRSITKI